MAEEEGIDDFEAGYLGKDAPAAKPTQAEPEAPADKPVETTEAQAPAEAAPKAETKPEPEAEPDWKKKFEELEKRTRNVEGHIGGLTATQKRLNETMAAAQAAAKKVPDAPTQQQLDKAIDDPAEWKTVESEYPEWAKATRALVEARVNSAPKFDAEEFQRKVTEQVQGQTAAARQEIIESALDAVLPGWIDQVKTKDFEDWMTAQKDDVKALMGSQKVGDAARMLRLYSDHLAKPKAAPVPPPKPQTQGRQDRFAAAVAPKGTAGVTASRSEDDEFESGYAGR